MCLGVPGRVVRWLDRAELTAAAEIDFGGVRKPCHMACVPDAAEGDYVLVHAGIAIAILDPAAEELLAASHCERAP
jgi:hydrogenase expression/formation protein HypC